MKGEQLEKVNAGTLQRAPRHEQGTSMEISILQDLKNVWYNDLLSYKLLLKFEFLGLDTKALSHGLGQAFA